MIWRLPKPTLLARAWASTKGQGDGEKTGLGGGQGTRPKGRGKGNRLAVRFACGARRAGEPRARKVAVGGD